MICLFQIFKANGSPDSNLRRHLGNVHNMKEFLYSSQLQTKTDATLISTKDKQELDGAIIEAAYMNGRSFNDFR